LLAGIFKGISRGANYRSSPDDDERENAAKGNRRRQLQAGENRGRTRGAQFATLELETTNTRAARSYQQHMGYRVASLTAVKRISDE
jgi:hypothetical protein